MTVPATDRDRATRFYSRLVALYPKAHRDRFGPHMQRTFDDSYRHATQGERRVGIEFWLAVLWDEGRSIIRERAAEPQGDVLFYASVLIWICAVMIAPVLPGVRDWHGLVLPATVFGALLLFVPGRSGFGRRFVTVAVALAVLECLDAAGQSLKDENDLLAPALLLACMAFSIKTMAGLNARIVGITDGVWGRGELGYGVLVGLAGAVGLAVGAANTDDNNPAAPAIFALVVPAICAVAGFRSSRRHMSVRSGISAAFGSMLIGAIIWILAEPLVAQAVLLTVFRDHPVPPATLLVVYWQRPLSNYLFWAGMIGLVGAIFGYMTTENETASQSQSQPHEG